MKTSLLLLILTAGVTYGRLGETIEECEKRYGSSWSRSDGKAIAVASPFYIRFTSAAFEARIAERETSIKAKAAEALKGF